MHRPHDIWLNRLEYAVKCKDPPGSGIDISFSNAGYKFVAPIYLSMDTLTSRSADTFSIFRFLKDNKPNSILHI